MFFYEFLYMDTPVLADQQNFNIVATYLPSHKPSN